MNSRNYQRKTQFEKVNCSMCGQEIIYKNKKKEYFCGECTMQKILLDRKNVIKND